MSDKSLYRSEEYITKVYKRIKKYFGKLSPPLDSKTNEQLAIAVILSAQCTDERVNQVTPKLFEKYPDMHTLAKASIKDIEKLIFSTGFYHNKANNIYKLSQILVNKYKGKIPNDFSVLVTLPGIGRKTANVIMNQAFHKAIGVVVDTHVHRISRLLYFTNKNSPISIEKDLMTIWPKNYWINFSLYLVFFGREFCIARRPKCSICILKDICPSKKLS